MAYIEIAIYAVPSDRKADLIAHSEAMIGLFTKHGALSAVDCWGANVPDGEVTSLPMAVKCKPDETVAYSHIIWPDKATYDAGMAAVIADMEAIGADNPMPFDGKRMILGCFETIVEA